jgi:hypothetical protein
MIAAEGAEPQESDDASTGLGRKNDTPLGCSREQCGVIDPCENC